MNESLRLCMIGIPNLRRTAPRRIPRPVHNSAGVIYPTRKAVGKPLVFRAEEWDRDRASTALKILALSWRIANPK